MEIREDELQIVDYENNEFTGDERRRKINELRNTGTMLDAWILGEDEDNPYEIIWE